MSPCVSSGIAVVQKSFGTQLIVTGFLNDKGRTDASHRPTRVRQRGTSMRIERTLFAAADKMRGSMDPGEYKHVALGLLFLRYIGVAFKRKYEELLPEGRDVAEVVDEYLAEGIFWVPEKARWSTLAANAKDPGIGVKVDDAMRAIETEKEQS